ncbi:hypothetical protein HanHA300_Chr02g0062771 [Helianthus annuus]|nr:hypothetical protein HanHA300_Chr02g0062771 [Helianthus annuus]KAJ0619428.1 hypothetical protein HanHA89_Chr02g0071281 [Helianthus annuus]
MCISLSDVSLSLRGGFLEWGLGFAVVLGFAAGVDGGCWLWWWQVDGGGGGGGWLWWWW